MTIETDQGVFTITSDDFSDDEADNGAVDSTNATIKKCFVDGSFFRYTSNDVRNICYGWRAGAGCPRVKRVRVQSKLQFGCTCKRAPDAKNNDDWETIDIDTQLYLL